MPNATKTTLSLCRCLFFSLKVTQTLFRCASHGIGSPFPTPPFIVAYMNRLASLEILTLLESTHSWSFSTRWKHNQWKQINPCMIVHVLPSYSSIPSPTDASHTYFCWSELYFPFCTLPSYIGSTDEEIINKKDICMFHGMSIKPPKTPFPIAVMTSPLMICWTP